MGRKGDPRMWKRPPGTDLATAVQHLQAGRLGQAEAVLRQTLDLDPANSEALHALGVVALQMGHPAPAVELIGQAISLDGGNAEYHSNLGVALMLMGRKEEGLSSFRRTVALNPRHAMAHYNIGLSLLGEGDADGAAASLKKAKRRQPNHLDTLMNLGLALLRLGENREAVTNLRKAAALAPSNPVARTNLGNALKESGDLEEALSCYREALALDASHAAAHYNMGNTLRKMGRLHEAVDCYRMAHSLQPDDTAVLNNLGTALVEQGAVDEAIEYHRRVLTITPDFAEGHYNLGKALKAHGRYDDSVAAYRRALEVRPGYAIANNNLGVVYTELGRFDEAEAAYRQAIEAKPGYPEAYKNLTDLKTYSTRDDDLSAIENLLSDSSLPDDQAIYLNFAMAKAHEDLGNNDTAFEFLEKANRLKRAAIRYSIDEDEDRIERIIATFDADLLAGRSGHGCQSDEPIFVLGMPRSGTTLVEQILASHSDVHGAGELDDLGRLAGALKRQTDGGREFPEAAGDLGPEALEGLGRSYLESARGRASEGRRFTDKMPANFLYIGLIHLILPKARIVHCIRDAADTCFSCYRILFTGQQKFAYDQGELGRYYRLYERLMNHWHTVLPGRVLDIRYEDVVTDQEGETRRLLDDCGLAWEDNCLRFHRSARPVLTASNVQVRQPLYKDAMGRWKRFERHLGPLLEALGQHAI